MEGVDQLLQSQQPAGARPWDQALDLPRVMTPCTLRFSFDAPDRFATAARARSRPWLAAPVLEPEDGKEKREEAHAEGDDPHPTVNHQPKAAEGGVLAH